MKLNFIKNNSIILTNDGRFVEYRIWNLNFERFRFHKQNFFLFIWRISVSETKKRTRCIVGDLSNWSLQGNVFHVRRFVIERSFEELPAPTCYERLITNASGLFSKRAKFITLEIFHSLYPWWPMRENNFYRVLTVCNHPIKIDGWWLTVKNWI